MPHVVVKMLPGRSAEQKARIAAEVTKAVMAEAHCEESSVSVGIEDVEKDRWTADVYDPEIAGKWESLFKKPGYGPKAE